MKIKQLEWVLDEQNWWTSQPPAMMGGAGYEFRVTDRGTIRTRRGNENWFTFEGSESDVKEHWQNDFEARIRSALE